MTLITDERLSQLRTILGTETCLDDSDYLDLAEVAHELQQLRQAVAEHNDLMSGCCQILRRDQWPPSTST